MTTIHTFHTAQGTKVTRKSQTRKYAACLVATSTEETVVGLKAKIEACEKAVVETKAALATLLAERNMTLAEAKTQAYAESYDIDGKSYHSLWDNEQNAVAAELGVEDGLRYRRRNEIEAEAKGRLTAKGILDPHREEGPGTVSTAGRKVEMAESDLSRARKWLKEVAVGNQVVLSWHLTLSNAQKALDAKGGDKAWSRTPEPLQHREDGYKVEMVTTFDVRETKPRAKKG